MLQRLTWKKTFFFVKVGLNSVVTWILGIFSDFVQLDVTFLKMGKAVTTFDCPQESRVFNLSGDFFHSSNNLIMKPRFL